MGLSCTSVSAVRDTELSRVSACIRDAGFCDSLVEPDMMMEPAGQQDCRSEKDSKKSPPHVVLRSRE